jgi:hypothetical protein
MYVLFAVGFLVFARFMPPPSPSTGALQLAESYGSKVNGIRIGAIMVCLGAALLAPYYGALCVQLKRIEGRQSPLTYAQLMLAACFILEFIFPMFIMQGIVYRPGRSLDVVLAMSDVTWLMFVGVVSTGALQFVVIAVAILTDKSESPVFPRWVGYFNAWVTLTFCVGNAIFFVKTGPLAWNGLLSWWTVIVAYGIWLVVMLVMTLKAVSRQEAETPRTVDDFSIERRIEMLEAEIQTFRANAATTAK